MANPLENPEHLKLQLPITESARQAAYQFAQGQPTPEKADQVRLNTLAVWILNEYCQMMGIPTALEESDSWHPVMQIMANVADLTLPGLGQLECRPVRAGAEICVVPPEVWDLRVGYVFVGLDDHLQTAHLLGFTPTVTEAEILLSQLQPLEALPEHLATLRELDLTTTDCVTESLAKVADTLVNLSQWFDEIFEGGWQAVETVLHPYSTNPAMSFRNASADASSELELSSGKIRRAKLIDLAVQLGTQQVALVVELQADSPDKTHIGLQVHPTQRQPYLHPGLELAVLEPSDAVFMGAQARQADDYIQLLFNGKPGEHFKVRIQMDDARYIQEFII